MHKRREKKLIERMLSQHRPIFEILVNNKSSFIRQYTGSNNIKITTKTHE